ncbi:hypothetical protein M8C21_011559, partial [Ambrosia artemisiifolia]
PDWWRGTVISMIGGNGRSLPTSPSTSPRVMCIYFTPNCHGRSTIEDIAKAAIVDTRHSYVVPDNESSDKVIAKLTKYVPFGVVPIVSI